MIPNEYQWPYLVIKPYKNYLKNNSKKTEFLNLYLENFFKNILGYPCIITPSGRSAFSLVLKLLNANRNHLIFSPKFSSDCLWSIIGKYSNPTTLINKETNIILAVHKFGIVYKLKNNYFKNTVIIEDSCDSLVTNPEALFPNNGMFEFFSLPKIMGIFSGGILIFRNIELKNKAKKIIKLSQRYDIEQGYYKWALAKGELKSNDKFLANEYKNFTCDYNFLYHLKENLNSLQDNKKIIQKRLELAKYLIPCFIKKTISHRLPPVLTINKRVYSKKIMTRYINMSIYLDKPKFIQNSLLPLHFGINDNVFEKIIEKFTKKNNFLFS
jgi:putative PLP-dependent aminotransferase (TIGR04422 family)